MSDVVTLYKVSEWNACILIFSLLYSVAHTISLFVIFSLGTSMTALLVINTMDLVKNRQEMRNFMVSSSKCTSYISLYIENQS